MGKLVLASIWRWWRRDVHRWRGDRRHGHEYFVRASQCHVGSECYQFYLGRHQQVFEAWQLRHAGGGLPEYSSCLIPIAKYFWRELVRGKCWQRHSDRISELRDWRWLLATGDQRLSECRRWFTR